MSTPCANSHASAAWPAVIPFAFAISVTLSTSAKIFGKFSLEKRGIYTKGDCISGLVIQELMLNGIRTNFLKSSSSKSSKLLKVPVKIPRPRGL